MRAMLNPGDEVLIPQPSYVSYLPCAVLADGVPVIIELEEKDQFRLTPEKLLEKLTGQDQASGASLPQQPHRSHHGPRRIWRPLRKLSSSTTFL